jgi:hypothetical protein
MFLKNRLKIERLPIGQFIIITLDLSHGFGQMVIDENVFHLIGLNVSTGCLGFASPENPADDNRQKNNMGESIHA